MRELFAIAFYATIVMYLRRQFFKNKEKAGDKAAPKRSDGGFSVRRATSASRGSVASDGHVLQGADDPTCRRFGHRHAGDGAPRYLVHEEPLGEDYITLNGMRVRLKDADKIFCR